MCSDLLKLFSLLSIRFHNSWCDKAEHCPAFLPIQRADCLEHGYYLGAALSASPYLSRSPSQARQHHNQKSTADSTEPQDICQLCSRYKNHPPAMSSPDVSPSQVSDTVAVESPLATPSISPLALQTSNSNDSDYINAVTSPRLDAIIEHVKADHIQLQSRSRVGSVSSISFKTTGLKHPTATSEVRPKRRSVVREVSPPAAP